MHPTEYSLLPEIEITLGTLDMMLFGILGFRSSFNESAFGDVEMSLVEMACGMQVRIRRTYSVTLCLEALTVLGEKAIAIPRP